MRHVILILFYPNEQRGGEAGEGAARLSLFVFFSVFNSVRNNNR